MIPVIDFLPVQSSAIGEWVPFVNAGGFFLATFVLEDAAIVGAGLLLAAGGISWPTAFAACFLGVWMGDAGLYGLARYGGRRLLARPPFRRFTSKIDDSERWFAGRVTPVLIFSRLVPGARLPTYLAAGLLRVPLRRFLIITGVAACIWTLAILFLVQMSGSHLNKWLAAYKHGGSVLLVAGGVLFAVLQSLRWVPVNFNSHRFVVRLDRWRHWEFWPAWIFYPPVAIYCAWLALKYRGLTLPTAANPGIFSGGMVGESKMATLKELFTTNPEFTAEAGLVAGESLPARLKSLEYIRSRLGLDFPFILKPDMGQRGAGIKLIRSLEQAEAYLRHTSAPLIAQRYVPGPKEIGIFYYRFPHESNGRIFAITEKLFPVLVGDGKSTASELVWNDPRARFMADKYLRRLGSRQNEVPATGVELKLVEAGNHAQGCVFRNGMHLCTPALEKRIDGISQEVTEFFIGRYDIRYENEEELKAGRGFQIIELNGAASEATSIYDARNSIFNAYQTLFRQWNLVFAIGAANRKRGCSPLGCKLLWQKWREYGRLAATYPAAD